MKKKSKWERKKSVSAYTMLFDQDYVTEMRMNEIRKLGETIGYIEGYIMSRIENVCADTYKESYGKYMETIKNLLDRSVVAQFISKEEADKLIGLL